MILHYKDIPVFYTDQGKGDTIVLLHGFLENSSMWIHLIPELSKSNRVVCIDLLGHGQTGCLGYIHSMEAMAETVEAVLKHLKVDSATFIGHSMGGYVALAYAELFADKMRGLCLMNSSAMPDTEERKQNRDRAILAVKQNYKAFISMSVSNLFAPENRELLIDDIERVKKEALKTPLQGIIAALEGMKIRKNRVHLLQKSNYKKLMIIGRKDPVLEYNTLIEQTQNTEVKIVEFSDGHMSHIENKREFTYIIIRFIEK
ncbi:MAG: alpha/beta hydrolase [Gelidibacter sp.]|nr:alpha/beta hydrolase [Gelidibacter sp.]